MTSIMVGIMKAMARLVNSWVFTQLARGGVEAVLLEALAVEGADDGQARAASRGPRGSRGR